MLGCGEAGLQVTERSCEVIGMESVLMVFTVELSECELVVRVAPNMASKSLSALQDQQERVHSMLITWELSDQLLSYLLTLVSGEAKCVTVVSSFGMQ